MRDTLSNLDRQILELVAQRQDAAKKIGQVKRDRGENTRDFAREKEVLEKHVTARVGQNLRYYQYYCL